MKKLRAMYKGYMLHPILYKTVTRTSIVAVLMLLWERYVSDGTFSMWEAPVFLCGVVLLIWAWVDYMRLDGLTTERVTGDVAALPLFQRWQDPAWKRQTLSLR